MYGGSRYMCGREPAGQLPTSSTMSVRAASTHGSSKVAVGAAAHPGPPRRRQRSGRRPLLRPRRSSAGRSCPRRPCAAGPRRAQAPPTSATRPGRARRAGRCPRARGRRPRPPTTPWRRARAGPPGVISTRWASTVRPDRSGVTTRSTGANAAHREVVAEEAGRPGQRALGPGGAQREGGDVAAARAPDLPVVVHHGGEAPVAGAARRPSAAAMSPTVAGPASQLLAVSSVTAISSPRWPVVVSQWVKPRCSMTRPDATFSGS